MRTTVEEGTDARVVTESSALDVDPGGDPGDERGTARPWRRGARWASLLLLMPVLWHVTALGRIFASRLTYPMDIEWMEGGALYHGYRMMHLQSVYGPPEQGFVPYPYPPLHAVILGGVGKVVGLDYWSGRLVSIFFVAVAAAVLLVQLLRHADRNLPGRLLAVLGVGMALASYAATAGWFDLIRNDSLTLALPLLAAGLVADGERLREPRRWVTVALLLVAAVYAKQTGLVYAAWIVLFVLVTDRRTGLRIALVASGVAAGLLLVAQLLTDGWFLTWMTLMGKHEMELERFGDAYEVVADFAPFLVLLPLLALFLWRRGWLSRRGVLWLGMLAAAVPAGLVSFLKHGATVNHLMPVLFLAGPVSVLLVIDLLRGLRDTQPARLHLVAQGLALAAAALFLVWQRYPVDDFVVTDHQRESADDLNDYVGDLDGGVLMFEHPFIPIRNGDDLRQLHWMPHYDATTADVDGTELERFVAQSRARWLLVSPHEEPTVRAAGWRGEPRVIPIEVRSLVGRLTTPTQLYEREP